MKTIPLTRRQVAIVSSIDYHFLRRWNWSFDGRYAFRTIRRNGQYTTYYLHRAVATRKGIPRSIEVDHRNRMKLDNRRQNLRPATRTQQLGNACRRTDNKSGYRGVHWNKECRCWRAQICANGRRQHLGYFHRKRDAALAYNDAASTLFGSYAWLNPV